MNGVRIDCIADTSAVVRLIRGDRTAMAAVDGRSFATTFVTAAELHVGILKSSHQSAALRQIESVLFGRDVLYPSAKTPLLDAEICHGLEQRGLRIPSNDIWIAAVAMEKNLPLIGRDEHFTRVEGLESIPC